MEKLEAALTPHPETQSVAARLTSMHVNLRSPLYYVAKIKMGEATFCALSFLPSLPSMVNIPSLRRLGRCVQSIVSPRRLCVTTTAAVPPLLDRASQYIQLTHRASSYLPYTAQTSRIPPHARTHLPITDRQLPPLPPLPLPSQPNPPPASLSCTHKHTLITT